MKIWSVFGASKAQPAKPEMPGAATPGASDWTSMFKVSKKAEGARREGERIATEEPTSVS